MNITEVFITRFYQSMNKSSPEQLSITRLSDKLRLDVHFWEHSSSMTELHGNYKVFINEALNERQKWQDFGHEMSHYFSNDGDRLVLRDSYVNYRETKADYFAYHFCVPTFMLAEIKGVDVYDVMNLFNVEFDFALRRLEMYRDKVLNRGGKLWRKDTQDHVVTISGN